MIPVAYAVRVQPIHSLVPHHNESPTIASREYRAITRKAPGAITAILS
jgi:hypothetical protein